MRRKKIVFPPSPEGDMKIEMALVDGVDVPPNRRPLNEDAVVKIMESFKRVGQLQPITVFEPPDPDSAYRLISGAHRLEAARRLGWTFIWVILLPIDKSPDEQRLVEIAENLHRADLTVLERSKLTAEWIRLTAEKEGDASQVETHRKAGQQPGGINAAVRALGIDRAGAHRAVQVASLSPEAEETAREIGLDDNQAALLSATKETDPAAQVAALQEHKKRIAKNSSENKQKAEAFAQWLKERFKTRRSSS